MSVFMKSKKKASSRQQVAIEGVRDGILLLPRYEYRAVLKVSSINFELKSEAEQDALIDTYQSFLNSLATGLQILVRVRELDMGHYIARFNQLTEQETDEVYKQQITNYTGFVQKLVTKNKILTRHFYVVVSLSGERNFNVVQEQLSLNVDIVSKGLARLGIHSQRLTSLELLDLFYSFYDPAHAKRQPLTMQTMRMLTENYV